MNKSFIIQDQFYSLVARYHQSADLYDAIERYLDLEEGLFSPKHVPLLKRVSQNIEKQESLRPLPLIRQNMKKLH